MADIFEQFNKSYNDNPWHADDQSSISQEEAEARSRDLLPIYPMQSPSSDNPWHDLGV